MPFLLPWLLGLLTLVAFPFAASLYWSFCRYDLLSPPQMVGFDNYERLADEMLHGGGIARALWNTAYFALLSVPLSIVLGIALAVMLSWKVKGRAIFRAVFFLPSVIPVVASSILWMWMLDAEQGIVNHMLELIGLAKQGWFQSSSEALFLGGFGSKDALVLMSLWGVGNFMIIYLAALGDIPQSLYEAAALDGAGPVRCFRHITLPMLTPVIFFNLVMGLIQSVQAFTQIYIVSEGTGEPGGSTLVLSMHLFLSAFKYLDMGYASAIAWMVFVLLMAITALLFKTSRHWVHYQGGSQ